MIKSAYSVIQAKPKAVLIDGKGVEDKDIEYKVIQAKTKEILIGGKWMEDKNAEYKVFHPLLSIGYMPKCFFHCHKGIIYALSCASVTRNVLKINRFEVNKILRRNGLGAVALMELINEHPNINSVILGSISEESDKFYEHLNMKRDLTTFIGDEMWLLNFKRSMTTEKIDCILSKIVD